MQEASHKIWAEQDDVVSRLMIQIGDDKPVCILEYGRDLNRTAHGITGMILGGELEDGPAIGCHFTFKPSHTTPMVFTTGDK